MGRLSLTKYPEKALFALLEQYYEKLDELDSKKETKALKSVRMETKCSIAVINNVLVNRFKDSEMPLREIANKILTGEEYEKDVYRSIFTYRILSDKEEMIDINLLEKTINELEIDSLHSITETKKGTIYGNLADKRYEEMMFEVEKDVESALEKKKSKDERLNLIDDILQEKRERANKPYTESPFTDEDIISIERFITHFLGIELDGNLISHSDLRVLNSKSIKTVDNTFAKKNEDYVHNNYLLLVEDKFKKVRTYVNPEYLPKILDLKLSREALKTQSNNMGEGFSKLLETYSEYEKKFNEYTAFEDINEELKHEEYLRSDKVLMKERDE